MSSFLKGFQLPKIVTDLIVRQIIRLNISEWKNTDEILKYIIISQNLIDWKTHYWFNKSSITRCSSENAWNIYGRWCVIYFFPIRSFNYLQNQPITIKGSIVLQFVSMKFTLYFEFCQFVIKWVMSLFKLFSVWMRCILLGRSLITRMMNVIV